MPKKRLGIARNGRPTISHLIVSALKGGVSDFHLTLRIVHECGLRQGLPESAAELAALRKSDERKALLAALLRQRTTVAFDWMSIGLPSGFTWAILAR